MKEHTIVHTTIFVLGLFLITPLAASAAPYSDVPTGSWYESIVQKFKDKGYLHRVQTKFAPQVNAIRADFVQLILDAQGGIRIAAPHVPSFSDVPSNEWHYSYMEEAGRLGWVKGDGSCYGQKACTARPLGNINRAEAASLLVRAFGFEPSGAAPHFTDNTMGQWYTNAIQIAADHCILQGDDATKLVRPSDLMNRAEMVAMIDRAQQRLTYGIDCGKIQSPAPKISSIQAITDHSIVVDFSVNLNPGSVTDTLRYKITNVSDVYITSVKLVRANAVEIGFNKQLTAGKRYTIAIQNMLTHDGKSFADTNTFVGYTHIADSKSTLSIATVEMSPVTLTIPRGALRVPVLSVNVSASCLSPYSMEGVTITRAGQGSKDDFDGVYAVINGERVSRTRTIDASNNTVSLHFTKPIIINACSTRRIDFMADVKETASTSGEHRFSIRTALDIDTNATAVQSSFPLQGSLYSIGAITNGSLAVEHRSVTPTEVRIGDKEATLARLSISANSIENHNLHGIMLKQNGSLKPGDIQNIRLKRTNGDTVSGIVKATTNDYILLTLSPPLLLKQGDSMVLEVAADIIGGAGRTSQLILEEESDIHAYGTVHGKNGLYSSRVAVSQKTNPAFIAIDAGGFIVEVDGPALQNYSSDQRGAVLANVLFTSGNEAANVRSMYVLVQSMTAAGNGLGSGSASDDEVQELIKNIKLRNAEKGRSISGVRLTGGNDSNASSTKTYQVYRFDEFSIRGKEQWKLEVDFVNNGQGKHPLSGDKFRVHICGEPTHIRGSNGTALIANASGCDFGGALSSKSTSYQMRVEGLSSGDRIGDVRPRGSISGNFHAIATVALTISQQSTLSADTTTKGAQSVSLLRFEAKAGTTKGVVLTRLSFEALAGSLQNGQNYQLWVDTNNDSIVDSMLQGGASPQGTTLTFNKISSQGYILPPNANRVFEVRSNIASSPPGAVLQLKFATSLSTFVEAEKVEGSTLAGTSIDGNCVGTCDIFVSTDTATRWDIVSQGNLFVTQSSQPIRPTHVLGGMLSNNLLRLQMRADNEAVDVTLLQIHSSGSTASSIERMELYLGDASQPFALATVSGCGNNSTLKTHQGVSITTFCVTMKNQQLVIASGQNATINIKAAMKTDSSGAISGQPIQLWVSGQTSGITPISARGLASSADLIQNNGDSAGQGEIIIGRGSFGTNVDVVGPKHVSALAKITSITNVNPDANGSSIPTGISDIAQFAFKAPVNNNSKNGTNDVVLRNLLFTLNASNVDLDSTSLRLVRKEASSIQHTCRVTDDSGSAVSGVVNGTLRVFCENLESSSISSSIENGQSAVFSLRANIVNPTIAGKSATLQVSLQNITQSALTTFGLGNSHIEWADKDGQTNQIFYWIDQPDSSVNSTSYRN